MIYLRRPMSGSIHFTQGAGRAERLKELLPQLGALVSGERDVWANLGNVMAAIREASDYHWVGYYRVDGQELVLGPFQGPVACTRIGFGRGVCGTAWKEGLTLVVPDVEAFPGHIACSALSRSEIVVPVRAPSGEVLGVLDADSVEPDDFGPEEVSFFESVAQLLGNIVLAPCP